MRQSGKMSKARKAVLIILAAIVLLTAAGAIFISQTGKKLDELSAVPVGDVDLSAVPDGTYRGGRSAFPIEVKVEVAVQNNKITAIDLVKHSNGRGKAAEAIPGRIVEAQSLEVDAISGATYSGKVILLAVKDALTSAAGK